MKILITTLLLFSYSILAVAQHHEIKFGYADLNFNQNHYNFGYEYLFAKPFGLEFQAGYSTESLDQSYRFIIRQGDDRQDWRVLDIRETLSRKQIDFTIKGKYYVFEAPRSNLFFISILLNGDLLLDQQTENIATLSDYNSYPRQVISVNPSTLTSNFQPVPQSRLNVGITLGRKFFLLKDQLFLEPELGAQLNLLRLREYAGIATLNLGYCLK
ncbi:MAG: hypothetical protein AAGG68_11360 [Bacteroidota bacterium]